MSVSLPQTYGRIDTYREPSVSAGLEAVMKTVIVADIHGCYKELMALLEKLDFRPES